MALNKPYEAYERPGLVVSYRMAAVRIFKGALVGVNSTGFAVPMSKATTGLKFVGVAAETVDNRGGTAGGKTLNVTKSGSFVLSCLSVSQSQIGREVFADNDWSVTVSAPSEGEDYLVGTIVSIESTSQGGAGCRVRIDRHTV